MIKFLVLLFCSLSLVDTELVVLSLMLVCFSIFSIKVVLSFLSFLLPLLFSLVLKEAVLLSWLSTLWLLTLLGWCTEWNEILSPVLYKHVPLYILCQDEEIKQDRQALITFMDLFILVSLYNKPFHLLHKVLDNCVYSFSDQV